MKNDKKSPDEVEPQAIIHHHVFDIIGFGEYFRAIMDGKSPPDNDGGYIVPQVVYVARPGLKARIFRLFNDDRGWEAVDFLALATKQAENMRVNDA